MINERLDWRGSKTAPDIGLQTINNRSSTVRDAIRHERMERVGNWLVSGERKDVDKYFLEGNAQIFFIVNNINSNKSQSKILRRKIQL